MTQHPRSFASSCAAIRFAAALMLWLAASPLVAAPSVTAQLDRNAIALGETVTLSLTFTEAAPRGTPQLPALPGLRVEGVSQSSQFNIVNGATSMSQTFSYTLSPTQEGTLTIPAMQIQVGNQVLTTQPLQLRVAKGAAVSASTNLAFLRLIVPKTEVFLGETFLVQVQLFFQDIEAPSMPELKAEGFTLIPTPRGGHRQTQARVGSMMYSVLIFDMAATAARAGDLTLGPAECPVVLRLPDPRARQPSPFDFFGGFGRRVLQQRANLASEPVRIRVLPLPSANVPPSFTGAVGTYQMTVTAGPTNLAVGDPITVQVQITGKGFLDALKLPDQPAWRDFNSYAPNSQVSPADQFGLSGTKTFEQVVVPQNHEVKSLPPLAFSFFDPEARSYRTLRGPEFPLTVRPDGVASAPPPALTNAEPRGERPPVDDLVHIRPSLENSGHRGSLLVSKPWFVGVLVAPPLAWLGLLIARKRREAIENNPRLVRQRQVARRIREGLGQLRHHAEAGESDPFFATLFRLLQEQIGERLDLPASAITEAIIDERLRSRGLSIERLAVLHELFQACNQARYAPMQTPRELSELVAKLETSLHDLQQLKC